MMRSARLLSCTLFDGVDGSRTASMCQDGVVEQPSQGAAHMEIATIGLDIAKNIFQVHGADAAGRGVLRRKVSRAKVLELFAGMKPCLVGMEACATSHYWGRELAKLGHEVRLMPPTYVKAYVKRNKNDAADAEAICEAVRRPTMRFVPVKSEEAQSVLVLHRTRHLLVKQRSSQITALRAHLAEHGIIAAKGKQHVRELTDLLRDTRQPLMDLIRRALLLIAETIDTLSVQIRRIELDLRAWHRTNAVSRRLETIPGVGFLAATAIAASVNDPKTFRSGRMFAAWLGLVPRQHSSGGKDRMGGISKMGNAYVRQLLVLGGTSILRFAKKKNTALASWIRRLLQRKPARVVSVAIANKIARVAWAVMARDEEYRAMPA
jgi:transposase